MYFSTLLPLLALSVCSITAAPTPLVHDMSKFEARYDASGHNNYARDLPFDNEFSVLARREDEFEDIVSRNTQCSWGHPSLKSAVRAEVKTYVENLAGRTCGFGPDQGKGHYWHDCGKSGFKIDDKTPQTKTRCEGCYTWKGKKKVPAAPPYTWKTTILEVDKEAPVWFIYKTTTNSLEIPPSQTTGRQMLTYLEGL